MSLQAQNRYQLNIEPVDVIQDQLNCKQFISDSFNISGFVQCQVASKAIKILFNPTEELKEELIFQEIHSILQQIGIAFIRITIRQFSFNLGRTAVAAATGGALGARAGPIGALLGGVIAAYLERELLCWNDVCRCECNKHGNLSVINLRGKTQ